VSTPLPTAVIRQARPHDHRATNGILAAIEHRLSNARIEQINTQIRLITRHAFAFHTPQAPTALAMLKLADLCPPLPQ
jgi:transposase